MSVFSLMTMPEIEALAEKKNCRVIVAEPKQIQIDLDDVEIGLGKFHRFYESRILKRWPEATWSSWTSKSGNMHITVELPVELSFPERIALQAMLGSDPGREFAALCCYIDGSPHPILFFKPKEKEEIK